MDDATMHERCTTLQQALIDLIQAVLDLSDLPEEAQEVAHLLVVLEAAMRLMQDDVPPLPTAGEDEATAGGCCEHPPA